MQNQTIGNMTIEDLKGLIHQVVDERLDRQSSNSFDAEKLKQVMEAVDRHRWTPPPGSPSVLELLREDRNR